MLRHTVSVVAISGTFVEMHWKVDAFVSFVALV